MAIVFKRRQRESKFWTINNSGALLSVPSASYMAVRSLSAVYTKKYLMSILKEVVNEVY